MSMRITLFCADGAGTLPLRKHLLPARGLAAVKIAPAELSEWQ